MRCSALLLVFAVSLALFPGCKRSGSEASVSGRPMREGDVKFIGFQYARESSAYMSIDSTKYMGDGYVESLNSAPHLKIYGDWCELTWVQTEPDGTKKNKSVAFPTSNIHSFKWKE